MEGDKSIALFARRACISIHALRVEGDSRHPLWVAVLDNFYPRPPGGGRLTVYRLHQKCRNISIHALRVEGDGLHRAGHHLAGDFYPRPPGGGRPLTVSTRMTR